ncbi:MAG: diguanylate cyclase [Spirochaetes bacterium]|jgi:PleD family two-component response regulator|nr:diguanylate cyclase [Spirochaetota bacterium]
MGHKNKILIAVANEKQHNQILTILEESYSLLNCVSPSDLIKTAADLILIDTKFLVETSPDIMETLQQNMKFRNTPVIIIIEEKDNIYAHLNSSNRYIDFIQLPINNAILKNRVKNYLILYNYKIQIANLLKASPDINAITGLPGNNSIMHHVKTSLQNSGNDTMLYCNINNFQEYNTTYGYSAGDKILQFTSKLLKNSTLSADAFESFIGHAYKDIFIIITNSKKAVTVADYIITRFDEGILEHYSKDDIMESKVTAMNREGDMKESPLMTITIAGVDLERFEENQHLLAYKSCFAICERAKQEGYSCIFFDRREKP